MAGEIHGIISREDAGRMWKPYGERVIDELDGLLDPDNITPMEAVNVTLGSNPDMQWKIKGKVDPERTNPKWFAQVKTIAEKGIDEEFVKLLVESNDYQNAAVAVERREAIDKGPQFIECIAKTVIALAEKGVWTPRQAEAIIERFYGPDGLPYMQYTPMTQLQFARFCLEVEKEEPSENFGDAPDFRFGIIHSAHRLHPACIRVGKHIKVHELVHAFVVGTEIYDVTRVDGMRYPQATVVGNFALEPTVEIGAGDDHSDIENSEIDEGWSDNVAQVLMLATKGLKSYALRPGANSYTPFVKSMRGVMKERPKVAAEITRSALVITTPDQPDAKREVMARMHHVADKEYGIPNALDAIFQQERTIFDIYSKGKNKATIKQ